jgi:hypothetical protein
MRSIRSADFPEPFTPTTMECWGVPFAVTKRTPTMLRPGLSYRACASSRCPVKVEEIGIRSARLWFST